MRLAFVVPRFEPQLAGGAEVHCQRLAEKVVGRGYKVEVFTTCARDHFSWKNHYEPGVKTVNGVVVRRFLTDPYRVGAGFLSVQKKIDQGIRLNKKEEQWWIKGSVRSQDMEGYIEKNKPKYDWFIFMPYLFGTTYWGIYKVPEKSLLIPCLHDEPFAYLGVFKDKFNKVKGIMFNTYPEMELAERIYNLNGHNTSIVSLGFDVKKEYKEEMFRNEYGIKDPFVLFAGRREGGKNINLLLEYFKIYKKYNNNDLKVILLGSGEVKISTEDRDSIIDLGYIPQEFMLSAYAEALVFCQPSVNESLSIVIMESWLAGRPVLVNERCAVTKDHCRRSNGGLYFKEYPEFEECINYLLKNPEQAKQMGANGNKYVKECYGWDAVLDRFEKSINEFK